MAHPLETEVLIIGAGSSGMVAALCLAQQGVSSLLVERSEGLGTHPKAHELNGRSIEILRDLGFEYAELAREASPHADASRVLFCDTIAREFGCIDLTTGSDAGAYAEQVAAPWPFLNVSQVELEKLLLRRVEQAPQVDLRWNYQWEALEQRENAVVSRITDRKSGEALTITSRYVICADGAGSRSRKALGIEMIGPDRLRDVVNAYLEADFSEVVTTAGKLYFIFKPEVAGSVFVAHHVQRRWVFNTTVLPGTEIADYTPDVMTLLTRLALGRDAVSFEIKSLSSWRMTAQVAKRFVCGRAFLVGDAAHRFPPMGGLGMNTGIGDVHNLSFKLAQVLRGRAPEALLATYEQERRPIAQINCDESRRNYENLLDIPRAFGVNVESAERLLVGLTSGPIPLPASWQAWIRRQMNRYGNRLLAGYDKDPTVRARVSAAIARQRPHFNRLGLELGYHYERGALLDDATPRETPADFVSHYIPSTHPGARFPHFWLDGNQRCHSSHQLLDPRRSTLIVGSALNVSPTPRAALEAVCERLGIQIRSLAEAPVSLACREMVHARAQIALDGALLVRPDGHVAWRQASGVELSAGLVESLFEQIYGVM